MLVAPWMAVFPGLAIFLAVMGWNLLGDLLRDMWEYLGLPQPSR